MIEPNYVMKCFVDRVIDGDTVVLRVSPAFKIVLMDYKFRLYGIDTAELNSKDEAQRELAKKAKDHVIAAILGKEVIIQAIRTKQSYEMIDSFGRYLVVVYYDKKGEQVNLNEELVAMGLAKVWEK